MKLLEFQIQRYGAIKDRTVVFDPQCGLVVVYGPNEIGKSTLLSAVSDFCFGVPNNSPHGSVFGYDAIRLRARLRLSDGAELNFRRRKGRGKTLTDDAGGSFDQDALGRVLGATTRERFLSLFGLNHTTLREGANRLLSAEGELGRLVIEAGGGLRGMVDRIAQLDPVIDGLFDLRRAGHRRFYRALDSIESADRTAKAALVSREAYAQQHQTYTDAQLGYEALLEQARSLSKRSSQLQRLLRVHPLVVELTESARALGDFEDLTGFAPGLQHRLAASLAGISVERQALARARATRERLDARRTALAVNPDWPHFEDRINDVNDKAVVVRKARQSLPNRRRELADSEAQLQTLRSLIGLAPATPLEPILPSPAQLDAVQRLAKDALERRASLDAHTKTHNDLADEIAGLQEAVDRARMAGRDQPFGVNDADLAALPDADALATAQGARLAKEAANLDAGVRRLGLRDLDHLRTTIFPDSDTLNQEIDQRTKLRRDLDSCRDRARDARAATEAAQRKIASLRSGAAIASPEAIEDARRAREQTLAPLVRSHLDGQAQGSVAQRQTEVTALQRATTDADTLADRRVADSDRAASLSQLSARYTEEVQSADEADRWALDIDRRLTEMARAFAAIYPAAISIEPDPSKLRELVNERLRLLDATAHLNMRLADVEMRAQELSPRHEALMVVERRCGLEGTDKSLPERVQAAIAAVRAHNQTYDDFVRDQRNVDTRTSQRLRVQGLLQTLAEAEANWSKRWSDAVAGLSLPSDVSILRAEEVAREWTSARGELGNLAQTRRRIAQIDADETDLRQMTDALSAALGVKVATDPVDAVSELKAAWGAHQKRWQEFSGLEPEQRQAAEEEQRAVVDLKTAESALNDIRAEVGAAEAELDALSERLAARDASADQHQRLIAQIRAAGDGFSIDELRQQCEGQDIDAVRANLEALDPERRRLDDLIKAAVETMQSADNQLKAYEDPTEVNQAIAERESAASEMHVIAEQWTEMTLARDILKEAISQVRAQHQDPLIARAGALFQLTTTGAFAGVAAEVDEDGAPVVVGRRADGARVGIREMSDGVRDQLFLSFRLASIERYGAAAEAIPFIADDILVNFDDERGAATLELLAEFGKANQVILFTHHQSVRDAATALLTKAPVQVIELANPEHSVSESQAA